MPRRGYVADAAADAIAAALSAELRLEQDDIQRIARAQVAELTRAGFRITVPVAAVATTARRHKGRSTT